MVLLKLGQEIRAQAHDACDDSPAVFITSVTDDQPNLGSGEGDTARDVRFGSAAACIRSECQGSAGPKQPRSYTITVGAVDHAGRFATPKSVTIVAPHDESSGQCPPVPAALQVSDDDPQCVAE